MLDVHAGSINTQEKRAAMQRTAEQLMQEERRLEEAEFMTLSSTLKSSVPITARFPKPSIEEWEMWNNHACSDEVFDAGVDYALAAVEERKCLKQEAANFDLWHGTDFLPQEDPSSGQYPLDELEQDDILDELLHNVCMYAI
jgi:hypothetical protein